MDNRPARVPNIVAFRESALNIRFQFPENYTVTDPSVFFRVDRQLYDLSVTPSQADRILTITIPQESVKQFPNKIEFYLTKAGVALLMGSIHVQMGGEDENDLDSYFDVTIVDDVVIPVYISGLAQIEEQVALAEGFAAQTAEDRTATENAKNEAIYQNRYFDTVGF